MKTKLRCDIFCPVYSSESLESGTALEETTSRQVSQLFLVHIFGTLLFQRLQLKDLQHLRGDEIMLASRCPSANAGTQHILTTSVVPLTGH